MKKILAIVLALVLACTVFVSCTAEEKNSEDALGQEKEEIKEPEKIVVSDFDDLMKKKAEAQKTIESFNADLKCVIDINAMEESAKNETNVSINADVKNKIVHTVVSSINAELEEPAVSESYATESATFTMDGDGEWFKHTSDAERAEEIAAFIERFKTEAFDYSKYISNGAYEQTLYGERECYKISYTLDLKLAEMLKDAGLEKEVAELEASLAQELDDEPAAALLGMISDLGTVSVTEYADVYTLYPVGVNVEMTQILQQLVDKLINAVLSMYGEGITAEQLGLVVVINEVSVNVTADSFNEVEVVVPEEVLSAPEFTEAYLEEEQDGFGITIEEEYSDF